MNDFSIAIHGGAGTLVKGSMTPDKEIAYKSTLQKALDTAYYCLAQGGSSVDAVEKAVVFLENSTLFNAGKGSVFTAEGTHEMDAAIMEGATLQAGGVSLITGIKNPICLARDIMEKSEHVFLAAKGAMDFALSLEYTLEDASYFYDALRYEQWQEIKGTDSFQLDHSTKKDSKFGTVGAVAKDRNGTIAAATSTGGMTNKKFGIIGDSAMIRSGT